MGKLVEALKKHMSAYKEYSKKPWINVETDPAAAYERLDTQVRLSKKRELAAQKLHSVLRALSPEQRLSFFRENVAPEKQQQGASRSFFDAAEKSDPQTFLTGNENNFGRPWQELIPILREFLGPKRTARAEEKLQPGEGDEKRVLRLFEAVPFADRQEFFNRAVTPERQQGWAKDYLEEKIAQGNNLIDFCSDSYYREGLGWERGLERLETMIPQQDLERIAGEIDNIPDPEQGDKLVQPEQARIEELRVQAGQDAEKQRLLEEAGKILTYPTIEYVQYLNEKNVSAAHGMDAMTRRLDKHDTTSFLNAPEFGDLPQRLPHFEAPAGEYPSYMPGEVMPPYREGVTNVERGLILSQEEQNKLRQAGKGTALSPKVRQAVLDITKGFDEIGEKKYWLPGVVNLVEGSQENPQKVEYLSEQKDKKYAFWPLAMAKRQLRKAVQDGNWDQIREYTEEYNRIKGITDKMMQIARETNPVPIGPENVNSTRDEQVPNQMNPVPTEYLEDYANHTRLNGAFVLYAVCKNLGVSVEQMLDDPGQVFLDYGKQMSQTRLLDSVKNEKPGVRLAKAMNAVQFHAEEGRWGAAVGMLNGRALSAVCSLCQNKEERIKVNGMGYAALSAASYEVGKELNRWRCLAEAEPEKKAALTQMAMLLPEEELDLDDLGQKLSQDGWEKTVNPAAKIDQLRKEGKLDYQALMDRSKALMEEATAAERGMTQGKQGASFYRQAALRNFRSILRTAPAAERQQPGYKALAAYTKELQETHIAKSIKNVKNFESGHSQLKEQIRTLEKEKSGWFLSKTNSPEYDRMMKHLRRFDAKLDLLAGKQRPDLDAAERQTIENSDPMELYRTAMFNCAQYSKEKSNYGNDNILHTAGRERNDAARNCVKLIGGLADAFHMRSPARKVMDDTEMELLTRRGSERWQSRNGKRLVAKYLCALSVECKDLNPELQKELFSEGRLDAAAEQMQNRPAFRQMAKNLGTNNMVGTLLRGNVGLTEAYQQAEHQVKHPKQGPAPQTSPEQKMEYWKNSPANSL